MYFSSTCRHAHTPAGRERRFLADKLRGRIWLAWESDLTQRAMHLPGSTQVLKFPQKPVKIELPKLGYQADGANEFRVYWHTLVGGLTHNKWTAAAANLTLAQALTLHHSTLLSLLNLLTNPRLESGA